MPHMARHVTAEEPAGGSPHNEGGSMRHFSRGVVGTATALILASPAVIIAAMATDDAGGRSARATMAAESTASCPTPYPVDQVTDGMTGWGLTVNKGTTPEKFTITVQGVLEDGIAPGIDLILADADSPALDAAGSIWAGMSGSPVYAEDGRLIGAVAYGFSGSSKLAGITPAAAMYDVLTKDSSPADSAAADKTKVKLPASLRRKVTARGLVSARAASSGLTVLPLPRSVSGLSGRRVKAINDMLAENGSDVRLVQTSAASGQAGAADEVVPGGNFGVLQSYGTITRGGIGTTTAVCDGRALAFGHPFFAAGQVKFASVSAKALAIVKDPIFGSYKLAAPGGVTGTVTQDRFAGISARLGAGPATTPVVARSTAGGATRTDTSYVIQASD